MTPTPDLEHDFQRSPPDNDQDAPEKRARTPRKALRQWATEVEAMFPEVRSPKKRRYLAAYAVTGLKGRAADLAGISRRTAHTAQWRNDPTFQEALARAERMAGDLLEDEIYRRAVQGIWKPTGWHKGEPGGYVREYSDLLLIFRTKAALPEKYRDQVQITGAIAMIDVTKLTDDQLARISAGEHPLAVLQPPAPVRGLLPAGTAVEVQPAEDPTGEVAR